MTKRLIFKLLLSLFLLSMVQCYHNRVTLNPDGQPGEKKIKTNHFFAFSLLPRSAVFSEEYCPNNGIYQVHSYAKFTDSLLAIFPGIFGIVYSPETLEIICNKQEPGKSVPKGVKSL